MTITLEQIDLLRKRANVNYKEAKEALEKFDGNIVEAIAYLEDQNKVRPEKTSVSDCGLFQKIKSIIAKGNKIKFVIAKNDTIILSLPLTLTVLIGFISLPFSIAALVLAIVTNCKIRIEKENGQECSSINNGIEKVSNAVTNVTNKVTEEIKNA